MPFEKQRATQTILVVDDEVSILTTVSAILDCDRYTLLMANNAEAALCLIEREDLQIDLMITDVVMPDLNGRELAERAWALRPKLRVLFMSGYVDSDAVRVNVLERTSGFLPKPFAAAELRDQVRKALGAPLHRSAVAGADSFAFYRSLTTDRN